MDYFQNRPSAHRIPVRVANHVQPVVRPIEPDVTRQPGPPQPATPANAQPETDWEAVAKRQQAEMDNFRKRQARRADEAIALERERLLKLVLPVADNLARALSHGGEDESLRQGIELTRRELERLLVAEGVTRLETVGQTFDPEWHEALATVPAEAASNTIVSEVEAGYKLNDKLLRPAKVIVAA